MASHDSESKAQFYSRKEKSLGVLCSNFLKLYNRDGVESIGLDSAATQLGVERRRIYDIVNILESVGVLARKAKNQYYWRGFKAIPQALEELRKQVSEGNFDCNKFRVSKEASDSYKLYDPRIVTGENDHGGSSNSSTDRQAKPSTSSKDNRKEKSLGLLTQNFIKLFLSSDAEMISLDTAATALLGDLHDPTAMRTKVRRLYDIANVFSSMDLIEKVRHPESGKPAFKWLGTKGNSKKRVFGTDLTNTVLKKPQVDSSSDLKRKVTVAMYMKSDLPKDECDENLRTHNSPHSSKDFVFGPFTPLNNVHARGASRNKKPRQRQDWENLASTYRPQYRNQAIDDLFGHYVDAWKSWHVKAEEEKPMQPVA